MTLLDVLQEQQWGKHHKSIDHYSKSIQHSRKKIELLISLSELNERTYGEDLGPTLKPSLLCMDDAMIYLLLQLNGHGSGR